MEFLNLNELSTEQKIGQLMVVRGYLDNEDRDFVYEMLRNKSVGGVQVNYYKGCEKEIESIKEAAGYPVMICADMECGFPGSEYKIPAMLCLAATDDVDLAYQVGSVIAIEAKKCGHNTVWSPNVDMVMGPALCRVPRTCGSDPHKVAKITNAVLKGFLDNGMFATAKHWPGGRDITVDTHMIEGQSELTEEDILTTDIIPYKYLMENAGLGGVMTKHVVYKNIDPDYPATLSEKLISLLRKQGFDGVIKTDSFAMMGILQKYSEKECYGLAIRAGNDMVLPNYRSPFKKSYEYLLDSYRRGVFTEDRLNEAVARVIKAQNTTVKPATTTEVSEYQKECFARIERDSICAIVNDGNKLPLNKDTKKLFVIVTENEYNEEFIDNKEITDTRTINKKKVASIKESVLKRFPDSEICVINQYPSPLQIENACYMSTFADEVIYITNCIVGSYRATISYTEKIINIMKSTHMKNAGIIHLGDPYTIESAPHMPRFLLSFGGGHNCIEYSLAMLNGEMEPKGVLPVELKLQ